MHSCVLGMVGCDLLRVVHKLGPDCRSLGLFSWVFSLIGASQAERDLRFVPPSHVTRAPCSSTATNNKLGLTFEVCVCYISGVSAHLGTRPAHPNT